MKYNLQPVKWILYPDGDSTLSEQGTHIEIDDEGAGGFVRVSQPYSPGDKTDGEIAIDPGEWPALREAIDAAIAEASKNC